MPGLCEFCSTEVCGDTGWREIWQRTPALGNSSPSSWFLQYERTFESLNTSTLRACFFCSLVHERVAYNTRKFHRAAPVYVLISIGHQRAAHITNATCASLHVYCAGASSLVPDERPGAYAGDMRGVDYTSYEDFRLDISTSLSDPAVSFYTALATVRGPYTNFDAQLAQRLLSKCAKDHEDCRDPQRSRLPKRVLDCAVVDACSRIRLREVEGDQHDRYAALSYVWGNSQGLVTLIDNIAPRAKGIDLSDMPQTLKDAVLVTRALDFQYLWIDALCIIQDSSQDMVSELARMHDYYRNAFCVIATSAAKGAADGFLNLRHESPEQPASNTGSAHTVDSAIDVPFLGPMGARGKLTLTCTQTTKYSLGRLPLAQRSWAFQERLLCARYLYFLIKQGFSLQCDHGEQFAGPIEDDLDDIRAHTRIATTKYSQGSRSKDFWSPWGDRGHTPQTTWRKLVREYACMELSVEGDRLIAIAALAEEYHRLYEPILGNYVAGLWGADLLENLLWYVRGYVGGRLFPRPAYRAPTWSWASVKRGVVFDDYRKTNIAQIEIVDVCATPMEPSLCFGAVKDGLLDESWSHAYPDTLDSMPQTTEAIHVLLFSLDGEEAYQTSGGFKVVLLKPYGKDTYRRVGYDHVRNPAMLAIFGDQMQTVLIV